MADIHPLGGRSLANEQEPGPQGHTVHGSQQVTASPTKFLSMEQASVFPRANKRNVVMGAESQFLRPLCHLASFP